MSGPTIDLLMLDWTSHTVCRACGSPELLQYLDLGEQAPANALRTNLIAEEFTAPLSVSWCPVCGLSQLDQVVHPDRLFTNYPFRAGASRLWREHCRDLVAGLRTGNPGFLVDVGSNDGTLLEMCRDDSWHILGIDPGGVHVDVPMVVDYWSDDLAHRVATIHGKADVITATNVFGHVDHAEDFLRGIATLLAPTGQAIIECPHILPLLDTVAFDTIYHEHLSYWSLHPLEMLAQRVDLKVVSCRMFPDIHGGSMRYTLVPLHSPEKPDGSVGVVRLMEDALRQRGFTAYTRFAQEAERKIQAFHDLISSEAANGKVIYGYGASAKGHVLLQAAQLRRREIAFVLDDTPEKQGLYTPGTGIPIMPILDLSECDRLVLLSWNNAGDLKRKAYAQGFRGQYIVPSPDLHAEAA